MEQPSGEPLKIELANLGRDYYLLQFLVNKESDKLKREMNISLQAGDLVGELYDEILKQYNDPNDDKVLSSLNELWYVWYFVYMPRMQVYLVDMLCFMTI